MHSQDVYISTHTPRLIERRLSLGGQPVVARDELTERGVAGQRVGDGGGASVLQLVAAQVELGERGITAQHLHHRDTACLAE